MDLQEVHNTIRFYLNRFQQGWYTPPEIDSMLDRAQMQLFAERQPVYAINQKIHDSLLPFKAEYLFTNGTSPAGLITLPVDYEHLLTVETVIIDGIVTLFVPVELLNEAEVSYRRSSQLIPLSTKYPVGLLKSAGTDKKFQIYPASVSAGTVYYLRRPVAPEFSYTVSGRTITYDQPGSTQLEWDDPNIEKIIFKALGLLGINLQAGEVIQVADAKDKQIA